MLEEIRVLQGNYKPQQAVVKKLPETDSSIIHQ